MSCIYVTLLICVLFNLHFAEAEERIMRSSRIVIGSEENIPREFLFIFGGLAVGAILRGITKLLKIPIPFRVLILLFGILLGVLSDIYPEVDKYTGIKLMKPAYISTTFFPVIFFKTAFCIDSHTFVRSWSQIFCIGVLGTCINACLVGSIMMLIIADDWSFITGLFFGAVCSTIYPTEIITILKEIGKAKQLCILLEGEMMIGDGTAIILFEILLGMIEHHVTTWYHVIMLFIRFAVGGVVLGYISGKITTVAMAAHNDSVNLLILTIFCTYLTFYIGEVMLNVSGVIAVVILGIMASAERSSLSANSELFLIDFWEMFSYIANTLIFLMAGITVPYRLKNYMTLEVVALILVMYVVVNVARFCTYLVLAPGISRIGYGLTFRNLIIAVWSGLRGPVPFCLTFSVMAHDGVQELGRILLLYVTALAILTLLINASTMPAFLRLLGLSELSMARKINMNNCMRYLQNRRDRAIVIMKMNRFLGDANWPLVCKSTVLKHPYKINLADSDDEDENYLGYRLTTCPDCQKQIPNEPTTKELLEMRKEARLRILKAKKISYSRQYENGMMSKESIRVLTQAVEIAMDTEEAVIELGGLHKLFLRQGYAHYIRKRLMQVFFKEDENTVKPPRKFWRRICYHIMMHPAFDIFIDCCIILNCIPIGLEIGLAKNNSEFSRALKISNTVFFLIYFFEFVIKVYGYSWIYVCKHGFKTYFSYYWNIFDFIILLFALGDLILDYYDLISADFQKAGSNASKITLITKLCRTLRLLRLLRLCRVWYPGLIKYCDSRIDKHLAFAYDVGKGFVTGEEDVSDKLTQMIDNKTIRDECRLKMEADRLAITEKLGMVQKDRPWIAITVKTKQAIRATLNSMHEAILELKVSGWVDDVEFSMIMESLDQRLKFVKTKIKSVQPIPPKVLFKEVSWMADDEQLSDFLYDHVMTKIFEKGDVVCANGQLSEGVYIIVTGMFKLVYEPEVDVIHKLKAFGMLPIVDYITSTRFEEKVEDYIVSGNSIGELSVLTGRPYNCTITAVTASQAYILTHDIVQQAIKRNQDPVNGIESKMWKTISIRLATTILMDTPTYQSSTQESIHLELERSFIPNLRNYKIFGVNDMMEDIVLLEGIAVDFNTRELFYGPCYIPRTVQKIVLPKSSCINLELEINTKLLIIPAKDVDEFDIMEREEDISEMVSTASYKCLQHSVQSKASTIKHRRKRQTFGPPSRRVKYLDALSTTTSTPSTRSRMTQGSTMSVAIMNEESELQNIDMNGQVPVSYIFNEKNGTDSKFSKVRGKSSDSRKTSMRKGSVLSGKEFKRKSENLKGSRMKILETDSVQEVLNTEGLTDDNKENRANNGPQIKQVPLSSPVRKNNDVFNTNESSTQEKRPSSDKSTSPRNSTYESKGNEKRLSQTEGPRRRISILEETEPPVEFRSEKRKSFRGETPDGNVDISGRKDSQNNADKDVKMVKREPKIGEEIEKAADKSGTSTRAPGHPLRQQEPKQPSANKRVLDNDEENETEIVTSITAVPSGSIATAQEEEKSPKSEEP